MPDNKTDIKIGVKYDGAGAQQALLDLEKLPPAARYLGEDINVAAGAADALQTALIRATKSMRDHLATLDPTSAGYARAAAQTESYIARQTSLFNRVENTSDKFAKQAEELKKLCRLYQDGIIHSSTFEQRCEALSLEVAKEQRAFEQLEAQMRSLSSRQQAQAMKSLEPPAVPARSMASWRGFFANIKQGFASGTLSLKTFLSSAEGLLRIGAWGAVAKTALDGITNAGSKIREQMGLLENKSISAGNFIKGFFVMASEGAGSLLASITQLCGGADSWFGKFVKSTHEVIGNISRAGAAQEDFNRSMEEAAALEAKLQEQQKQEFNDARKSLLDTAAETFSASLKDTIESAQKAAEDQKKNAQELYDLEAQKLDERTQSIEQETRAAEQQVELALARGELEETQAKDRLASIQKEHDQRLADIQEEASVLKVSLADDMQAAGDQLARALQQAISRSDLQKFAPVLEVKLPDEARMREIEMQLKNPSEALDEATREALLKEQEELKEEARKIASLFRDIDENLKPTPEEALDLARRLQEQNQSLKDAQRSADEEAQSLRNAAATARQNATLEEQKADASRQSADATAEIAREEARRKQQTAALNEQLKSIEDQYKTSTSYATQANKNAADQLATDRYTLELKEKQLMALAATPDMDASTAAAINNALTGVRAELQGYKDAIATNKEGAQRQITEWKSLNLKATSAGLQGNLNRLEKAYAAQAKKAEEAARKGDDKALNRATKALENMAWRYEQMSGYTGEMAQRHQEIARDLQIVREGANGLTASQERYVSIAKSLNQADAAAKESAKGLQKMGENAQKAATNAQQNAKSSQQNAKSADESANAQKRGAAAAKTAAAAKEKEATAAQQAADAAKQAADAAKQNADQGSEAADPSALQSAIDSLNATVQEQTATLQTIQSGLEQTNQNLTQVNTQLSSLNTAFQQLSTISSSIAQTAASGFSAAQSAIANLQRQLNALSQQVDRLNRP